MAWKYKRGGVWWIGYRLNGRQILRSTKRSSEADANREIAKLNALDQAHKAGSLTEEFFRLLTNNTATADSLRGFVKQWLAECKDLSAKTLERYREVSEEFCEHLNATDSAPLLRDIRPEIISVFLRQKRAATSTGTAKLFRRVLTGFFNYAVDNRALQISPVPSAKSLKLTKDNRSVRRAFTLEELKTLYQKAPDDFWRYMLLAGFYCGQRMGDLITLPWGAVDFEQNQIRMIAAKTGKTLTIPLRAELGACLNKLRLKAGTVKPSDPIWPEHARKYAERGAGVFSNEFYDEILLPAGLVPPRSHHAKKSKTGEKSTSGRQISAVSFHCLRHTFVSLLKATGGSQAVAKELAGHSTDAVNDLYTHLPEDVLVKAIERLPKVSK